MRSRAYTATLKTGSANFQIFFITGTSCSIIAFADLRASLIIGRTDLPMLLNIGVSSCAMKYPAFQFPAVLLSL
jgi:hypothetical protein